MEYRDLSPYAFLPHPMQMKNVGWLGPHHGVQSVGKPTISDLALLRAASQRRVGLTLGWHECEFCPEETAAQGNGEYRYYTVGGEVYVAPVMILHYAVEHDYLPPRSFLDDLAVAGELRWDRRADLLAEVALDGNTDLELRGQAVTDLAFWEDSRGLEVGLRLAQDEEFADCAGDRIGFLIGVSSRAEGA